MNKCPECGGNCAPECGRHPAGCIFGGPDWGKGYWLKAQGCPLGHPEASGAEAIAQVRDHMIMDTIYKLVADEGKPVLP